MKRRLFLWIVGMVTVFLNRADTNSLSTSVQLDERSIGEVTRGLAQYENVAALSGRVTSVGSGTGTFLLNHWAVEFSALYPEVDLDIRGGGVNTNVLDRFIEGKIDIVPISREVPSETMERFRARNGYELAQIIIGPDALGVYVNRNNPVAGLTMAQLEELYSRTPPSTYPKLEFWSDLGVTGRLGKETIRRYSLSQRHGGHQFFKAKVLHAAEYRFSVRFESIHSSLIQAIGSDDTGIGFESILFATARTRFVPIQSESGEFLLPTYTNVVQGKYPLIRPIRVMFNRKPNGEMNPVVREFLRFAVSRRGQRVNAMDGGFPLTPDQQREALALIGTNTPALLSPKKTK